MTPLHNGARGGCDDYARGAAPDPCSGRVRAGPSPPIRRTFIRWAGGSSLRPTRLRRASGGLGGGSAGSRLLRAGAASTAGSLPKQMKVGVIAPTSGIGAFLGDITQRSLGAARQHIREAGLFKGTEVDYEIVNPPAEASLMRPTRPIRRADRRPRHHRDPLVHAHRAQRGTRPDPARPDPGDRRLRRPVRRRVRATPRAPSAPIFQLLLPDTLSFDHAVPSRGEGPRVQDRGLVYDGSTLGATPRSSRRRKKNSFRSRVSRNSRSFPATTAGAASAAQRRRPASADRVGLPTTPPGSSRVSVTSVPTTSTPRPRTQRVRMAGQQILGYPGGTGEKTWAELAGDAAKGESHRVVSGGLVGGPHFAIRDWLVKYDGKGASGGEEGRAERLVGAVAGRQERQGSDRRKMVTALEQLAIHASPACRSASVPSSTWE